MKKEFHSLSWKHGELGFDDGDERRLTSVNVADGSKSLRRASTRSTRLLVSDHDDRQIEYRRRRSSHTASTTTTTATMGTVSRLESVRVRGVGGKRWGD